MDLRTRLITYTGPLMPDVYNRFFNPNICHVCKSSNGGTLILCEWCYMISYCSLDHQRIHQEDHILICKYITKLFRKNRWYFTRRLTQTEWFLSKNEILFLIQRKMLSRRLLLRHEVEMLLFARSCLICHRQSKLRTCNTCYSANICIDHTRDFYNFHTDSVCKELLLLLNINIILLQNTETYHRLERYPFFDEAGFPSNMLDFIGLYGQPGNQMWAARPWTNDLLSFSDYWTCEHVTDMLTLYYGMRDANLVHLLSTPVCIIHIIFPIFDIITVKKSSELLLHILFDEVQEIIIVVTDPKLRLETFRVGGLCARCMSSKKIITVQFYPWLYQNYVFRTTYRRPNVILGFHPKISNITTDCFTALQRQNCPVLLTAKSLFSAQRIVIVIDDALGIMIQPVCIIKNKFRSFLPRRCCEYDTLYYRNFYLLIYENLNLHESLQRCSRSLV